MRTRPERQESKVALPAHDRSTRKDDEAMHSEAGNYAFDRRSFLGLAAKAGALALVPLSLPRALEASLGGSSAASAAEATGTAGGAGMAAAGTTETARCWRAMGTLFEVRVPDLPRAEALAAIRAVRRRVEELEAALTLYRSESPLVAFNRASAMRWMDLPADLADALAGAVEAAQASGQAYDPTVAPLMRAWGLVHLEGRVPPAAVRRAWRRRPGSEAVEIDRRNRRARRLHREVEIDLGGIGKGIAVDEALAMLTRAGSRSALVNFGGSIGVLGAPPGSPEGWPVGIVHPRRTQALWSTHLLRSGHLATSGDYERCVEVPGGRAHHLLDPHTGEPARGVASATVWSARGVDADLRSTAVFIARARGEETDDAALILLEGESASGRHLDGDRYTAGDRKPTRGGIDTLTARATGGFGTVLG